MPKPIIARFMRAFADGLLGQFADKVADVCFFVGPLIILLGKNNFSVRKIIAGQWESVTIVVIGLSGLVLWHAVRSAFVVGAEVKQENLEYGFSSSATRLPFARTKLTGIVLILSGTVFGLSYLSWARIPKLIPTVDNKPPASTAPTKTGSPKRPVPTQAQMEGIKDLSSFIAEPDEMSLRTEFGYPEMMDKNIRGIINNLHRYRREGVLHHYALPPGQTLIDSRFADGHIRKQGGAWFMDYDDLTVFFILLPNAHTEAVTHLKKIENSPELPVSIVKTVKEFDGAIARNNTTLIEVLHGAMTENKDYFFEYDNPNSPFFHKIDDLYLDKFLQLRPKADKVRDAIRKFLAVT